jgi:dTDP-4-dehydrorhamnose reductase
MRLLVFGGWGQLGTDLANVAGDSHTLVRPRHAEVDITDAHAVGACVAEVRPDAVVNMAAFHKVDRCQEEPETTFAVNAVGALNVARAAQGVGARVMYVSTDYVFDGSVREGYREQDPVGPVNVYGVSKVAGEAAVFEESPDAIVVRGSGLFGHAGSAGKGGNFVDTMLAKGRRGEAISVVDDTLFSPTATYDMAGRMLGLLELEAPSGIYHAANSGTCSWYELARTALELAGIPADLSPRPTGETPVRRPQYSVLLDTKASMVGLPESRPWQDALRWYLANRPPAAT